MGVPVREENLGGYVSRRSAEREYHVEPTLLHRENSTGAARRRPPNEDRRNQSTAGLRSLMSQERNKERHSSEATATTATEASAGGATATAAETGTAGAAGC